MVSRFKKIVFAFTRPNKKILLAVAIMALLIAAGAYYLSVSLKASTSPLSSRTVSAAKVPEGWYEHMVEIEGAPAPTIIVLTKNAVLPYRNAGDGQYDDPQIMITSATIPSTPEDYIAQEGLSGENTKITGVSGTWSTFMGHKMFAIDLDQVGNTVILFGTSTVYTLILSSSNPQDTIDFWKVIAFYAQPEFYADMSSWKTYIDPSTGFTITYPPQYAIEVNPPPPTAWASRTLLQDL
jgi:hypothetical protein